MLYNLIDGSTFEGSIDKTSMSTKVATTTATVTATTKTTKATLKNKIVMAYRPQVFALLNILAFLLCFTFFCLLMANVWNKFTRQTTTIGSRFDP